MNKRLIICTVLTATQFTIQVHPIPNVMPEMKSPNVMPEMSDTNTNAAAGGGYEIARKPNKSTPPMQISPALQQLARDICNANIQFQTAYVSSGGKPAPFQATYQTYKNIADKINAMQPGLPNPMLPQYRPHMAVPAVNNSDYPTINLTNKVTKASMQKLLNKVVKMQGISWLYSQAFKPE